MKPYNILDPTDQLQEGDEAWLPVLGVFQWVPVTIWGVNDLPHGVCVRRPIPPPQWQTGEIPKPNGRSYCLVEKVIGEKKIVFFSETPSVKCEFSWEWQQDPNRFLRSAHTTGRWYIQQITLPL